MSHIIQIYNAQSRFYQAGKQFVFDELYNSLKYHYQDICCDDDLIIDKLVDALNNGLTKEEILDIDKDEIIHNITHTIEVWLYQNKMTPDPFWADDINENEPKVIIITI
jgi:hypothetical protein